MLEAFIRHIDIQPTSVDHVSLGMQEVECREKEWQHGLEQLKRDLTVARDSSQIRQGHAHRLIDKAHVQLRAPRMLQLESLVQQPDELGTAAVCDELIV